MNGNGQQFTFLRKVALVLGIIASTTLVTTFLVSNIGTFAADRVQFKLIQGTVEDLEASDAKHETQIAVFKNNHRNLCSDVDEIKSALIRLEEKLDTLGERIP